MPVYGPDIQIPDVSIQKLLWKNLLKYEDKVGVIDSTNGISITNKELYDMSRKCAAYLQSKGIRKGDVIALCTSKCIEFVVLMYGIIGSGASLLPCNPSYHKFEMLNLFEISRPKMAFVEEKSLKVVKDVQEDLSCINVSLRMMQAFETKDIFIVGSSNDYITYSKIMETANADALREVDIDPNNDIAIVSQSSGTTGLPKCVLRTHRNYVSFMTDPPLGTDMTSVYSDRPIYRDVCFNRFWHGPPNGITAVIRSVPCIEDMLRDIETYKITCAFCTPPILMELLSVTEIDKYDLSSLKRILVGGTVIPPHLLESVMDRFNVSIRIVYGLTEVGATTVGNIPGHSLSSCGKALSCTAIKVVNSITGKECEPGEDGEVMVKGVQVMKEYMDNPEATAEAFDNEGWFKTGDLGRLDNNEELYIVGRLKFIIEYRRRQVSPAEIEALLLRHPKIADAGVIGIPDEECRELPMAFIVPTDRSLTAEEVHKYVNENLMDYKRLRGGVKFTDSIPKSVDNGKILRKVLRKMAGY